MLDTARRFPQARAGVCGSCCPCLVTNRVGHYGVSAVSTSWSCSPRCGGVGCCSLHGGPGSQRERASCATYVRQSLFRREVCTCDIDPCGPRRAGQALVDLFYATNGYEWREITNWLNGDPCINKWYGVGCSGSTIVDLYVYKLSACTHAPAAV